jgi:hypothetical protein
MRRASCLVSIVAAVALAVPGCSGSEFTAGDGSDEGEAGETATGGNGASSGQGGSSSGTGGTDSGGSDVGGNGNGGSSRGGNAGTGMGGAQTGGDAGDAGDGASGGSDVGGMSGTSGANMGGAGAGIGGGAGRAGAGAGGLGGAGSGGNGGSGGAGSGGKAGSGGAGSGGKAGSGGAGSGGKAGSGGTSGTGGAGPSMCPPNAPSAGSACSFIGHCSYGTHPLQRCRDVYACDGARWQLTQDASCGTPPSCESLPTPPVINAQCMPEGAECLGANNLYCLCAANCSTFCSLPIWQCFGAPGDCPAVLPNRGQPCNVNLSCVYGSCASQTGVQAICENGVWVWYGLICPQ